MASTLEEKLAKDEEYLAYEHPKATELKAKKQISNQAQTDLDKSNAVYDSMIDQTDQFYSQQADAVDKWGQTQTQLQQDRTDFTIEQINQQKAQAEKDYAKEQKGAYTDYQKQTDEYGANAEAMASQGMAGTGYSESAKVSMYNQYQNRVAVARESYNKAVLEYDNAIKEAQLQNNSVLAEIAFNTLQQKLAFVLQGFQSKNSLILEKLNQGFAIDDRKYARERDAVSDSRWREQWEYQKSRDAISDERYADELGYSRGRDALSDERYANELEYAKGRDAVSDSKWRQEMLLAQQKADNTKADSVEDVESFTDETVTAVADNPLDANTQNIPGNNGKWVSATTYVTDTHVRTSYYDGEKNVDGKEFGYFKNEYQPKGIKGLGKVHKSYDENGDKNTITFTTTTLDGRSVEVTQNVWETEDGKQWVWDGRQNMYVPLSQFTQANTHMIADIGVGGVTL